MGGIVSRLRQSNDSDYEKILSDLDNNIRRAEIRLSAIHIREKRLLSHWLIYTALAWIVYTIVFAIYLHPQYQYEPQPWAFAFAPIVAGIPVIYIVRSLITVWYKRAKTNEEAQLSMLRADQRLKVEELKKKTAYYSTKTLLERYDPSSKPSGQRPISQNGHPKPQQPNMMDPGMRQRQGLGVTNAQGIPLGQGQPVGSSTGIQHPGQGPQNGPRGPQGQYGQSPQFAPGQRTNGQPNIQYGSSNTERHWYDKIVDVIVGDEGPETKYALICGRCYAHNGLALPQEIEDIQYVCPKCNFFNPSRRKVRVTGPGVQMPSTPEMTLLQAQAHPLPISREPSPSPSLHRSPLPENHHQQHQFQQQQQQQQQRGPNEFEGPGLAEGNSPEPVTGLPHVDDPIEHSEMDESEFVNNWNDSDAEGMNHDEGDDEEVENDDTKGYNINSEEAAATGSTRKTRSSNRTRASSNTTGMKSSRA
ncbi:hypothetical protein BGZ76_001000 [Entomortierella beljakovae]|nr:hypothetical protein BGZ76_001000 [Entomortierella beljakovae]